MVGERVFRSFYPQAALQLRREEPDGAHARAAPRTRRGRRDQQARRRVRPDRLREHQPRRHGRGPQVRGDRAGRLQESLKHHHNVDTMLHSQSYMDPREGHSAINDSTVRMGRVLAADGVKVFQIETTLNSDTFPGNLGFLNKREWEWSLYDQGLMMAAKQGERRRPRRACGASSSSRIEAPYKLTGINAGEVEAVHERTLVNLHRQQLVEVQGQSDVLIMGLPYLGPYNVNSILNPILVALPGTGLPLQHVPEQAARARGRRGDPLSPGAVGVQPDPPPLLHRLLRRGAGRDHGPEDDRVEVRGEVRHGPVVHRTCTGPRTRTTACTRSTCGTGGRTAATTSAT